MQLANLEWTKTGEKYMAEKELILECGFPMDRDRLVAAFARCEWRPFVPGESVAFSSGAAINKIVATTRCKDVVSYAISHEMAPYGLYGVEFEYSNAVIKSYWLDDGCACVCLALEPYYIEDEEEGGKVHVGK